jgi:hypothetical protein
MFNVSRSKVALWRKCRRAYHYKLVENLRAKKKSRPLQFGSIVHKMLEEYAEGNDPFEILDRIATVNQQMFAEEREEYGNIIEDIRCIMSEYFDHWDDEKGKHEKAIKYVRIKGKSSEHDFSIDIGDIRVKGRIDSIARTPFSGLRWLVEHKTFGSLPNEDHRWRNLQSSVYIKVMQIMGWKRVDGILWDYIKSKSPTAPQLLKSGKLSKKAIDTLPSRVTETLIGYGLNPKAFGTLIMSAQHNKHSYFQRIFNPTKQYVVDAVFDEFMQTAREMSELHGKSSIKNIERHCDWCDFEPICRAELQGSDVDFVKERQYYVSKDDYEELAVGEG